MLATALIIAVVFGVVYFIVQQAVYKTVDDDLTFEANKHKYEINVSENHIQFKNKDEWEESEHKEVQVNPVFLQLTDEKGSVHDKSPNLKENRLPFRSQKAFGDPFNIELNNRIVRQVQIPIIKDGKTRGFIVAAMSLDAALMVLQNLRYTLFLLFPVILLVLFFISSFLAGRSIIPVVSITETANRITKKNLNERIELPPNEDELHDLSSSINALLGRLESALEREKQFTSDASHELRTPLSILRGTLEVLIRKERTREEYEEKISYSLSEIDRMANIIDQLLELARFDVNPGLNAQSTTSLSAIIHQIIVQRSAMILDKNITIQSNVEAFGQSILVNSFHANLILNNVIGNAIKYSNKGGTIEITLQDEGENVLCSIKDFGIGIKPEDLNQLFTPFFRSDALNHTEIKGVGLGLSIARKAAIAINAELEIVSELHKGTEIRVNFKEILRESEGR